MKRPFVFRLSLLLVLCVALALGGRQPTAAQSGSGASPVLSTGYDLTWNTIDNGGGESVGSDYSLAGTIGQPDAVGQVGNLPYTLNGGFWGTGASQHRVYLPVVIK